jgi:hypothetical protein
LKVASLFAALLAGALLTSAAQATGGSEVIRFLAVKVSEKQPNDKSFIINENDLVNGKKVGHDTLTCKIVDQNHANCSIVIVFSAGKLNAKFVLPLGASSGKGTITGGTGKYAGAKGTLTWRNLNTEGTRTSVVLRLA